MFGFLKPGCGDRKYRQIYAAHCSHQRQQFGVLESVFTSYEAVFLYCLAIDAGACASPADHTPQCCRFRNDWANNWAIDHELASFCSALAMILAETKLQDDIRDSKRIVPRIGYRLLRSSFAKAHRYFDRTSVALLSRIRGLIDDHTNLEKGNFSAASHDEMRTFCQPTASAFGIFFREFALLCGKRHQKVDAKTFEHVGQFVGATIVSSDCVFDWHRDRRDGSFNPLLDPTAVRMAKVFALDCVSQAGWLLEESMPVSTHCQRIMHHTFRRLRSFKAKQETIENLARSKKHWPRKSASRLPLLSRAGVCDCGGCDCGGCDCGAGEGLGICGGCCDNCDGDSNALNTPYCFDCCGPCDCPQSESQKPAKDDVYTNEIDKSMIGKKATVVSALLPFGVVSIDGVEHPAKLIAGHADVGNKVLVTDISSFGLIVESDQKTKHAP